MLLDTKGVLSSLPTLLGLSLVLYGVGLVVYRLFLHPLAKFPGPKIAAVLTLYEAYFEIVLKGQYSKEISRLHDVYGMLFSPNLRTFSRRKFVSWKDFWITIAQAQSFA
jgi:hypothetical protein